MRDTSRDGIINRIEAYTLSHFEGFWRLIMAIPPARRWVNKKIIGRAARRAPARPHALSSMPVGGVMNGPMAGYTSWESLTDRDWFSRHGPPRKLPSYPDLKKVEELFKVGPQGPVLSETSSVLFLSFAQWFTDGFLMTERGDRRRTHTSHHIDLNPLYGLTRVQTQALREMSEAPNRKGRLKSEKFENSEETFAPRLYDEQGNIKREFESLRKPLGIDDHLASLPPQRRAEVRNSIFAFGGERANTTPFTAMLNTLFLREHNRLAAILEKNNPAWDDERIFQTARNINIAQLIKIVIEEYINHISPYYFQLSAEPVVCWREYWNKPNWIPIEFDLLYRWHSLVPDRFNICGTTVPATDVLFDNNYLTKCGLAQMAVSASSQRAWHMGLFNTAPFLVPVEVAAVMQSRMNDVGSYNDYREIVGVPRVTRFEQITGDKRRIEALRSLYGDDPENVEFFVGLFAEDVGPRAAVPSLVGRMVALDAFSQALTNPLLSENVFNEKTFTTEGMNTVKNTRRLEDVINRNLGASQRPVSVSMEYQEKR